MVRRTIAALAAIAAALASAHAATVIASRANEVATEGGKVRAGTRTEAFMQATKVPVHLPLSGRTMSFDAGGTCVDGC